MRSSDPRAAARANARPGGPGELAAARALLLWWPLWLLIAAALAALATTYQVSRTYTVNVGTGQDEAYVRNFHARLDDQGRPFRWSDVYGYVLFPGLGGSRPFTLSVALDPGRPAPVTAIVNGESLFSRPLQPGWQTIQL